MRTLVRLLLTLLTGAVTALAGTAAPAAASPPRRGTWARRT
ncbi:hypothetical protein ACPL_3940 [Actinoplanes sp. SE50/110]|nr:hypothetical protein [Actinoplanes sp. SE50/110]AEV84835.1 hypothetical protein ACPL_3940 [Actinoplanes sp. SE50/110]